MPDRALVVGLGEIGKPIAEILSEKHEVQTLDIKDREIKGSIDIMHICIPGDLKKFNKIVSDYIKKFKPELTIIHSTVIPGTCRKIYKKTKCAIVHSPVRGKHVDMKSDIKRYIKFLAGNNMKAAKRACKHLQEVGLKVQYFKSLESSELSKIMSTTYFGLLIVYAQIMDRYCKKLNVDYYDIMKIVKEIRYLPRVIFEPGYLGGHCIQSNLKLLKYLDDDDNLIKFIRESNKKFSKENDVSSESKKDSKKRKIREPRRL